MLLFCLEIEIIEFEAIILKCNNYKKTFQHNFYNFWNNLSQNVVLSMLQWINTSQLKRQNISVKINTFQLNTLSWRISLYIFKMEFQSDNLK